MTQHPARAMAAMLAVVALLITSAAWAFETPLESHSIRDGYFLGQRGDEKLARFLDTYTQHLPLPKNGAYISEIKLLTPYALVVDISRQKTSGYSAQQAEQEYKDRGDTVRVYVRIELTATYGFLQAVDSANRAAREQNLDLQPQDFWRDFQFVLSQEAKPVDPRDVAADVSEQPDQQVVERRRAIPARAAGATTINSNSDYNNGLPGAVVWLDYNANEIASEPISFEVLTPAGQHAAATFDLSKLR